LVPSKQRYSSCEIKRILSQSSVIEAANPFKAALLKVQIPSKQRYSSCEIKLILSQSSVIQAANPFNAASIALLKLHWSLASYVNEISHNEI